MRPCPEPDSAVSSGPCTVDGCDGQVVAVGLCCKHYKRLRRHGDTGVTLRRHRQPHQCRHCGSRDPSHFYPGYRGICKGCQKRQSILRRSAISV